MKENWIQEGREVPENWKRKEEEKDEENTKKDFLLFFLKM